MNRNPIPRVEPITLATLVLCYGLFALGSAYLPHISLLLAFVTTTFAVALHSSLQHEALHGHPTRLRLLNELLVFPALGLFIPYGRFRDLHLAHHRDEILTDPHDDPESNYRTPQDWRALPAWRRRILQVNNTLAGRLLLGPVLSCLSMYKDDLLAIRRGEPGVARAYVIHAAGLLPVAWWLGTQSNLPLWLYPVVAYCAMSLLKIRTFLEHRANPTPRARTVIIEDRGPLAFLFLNNNYHIVHHSLPAEPWYRMQTYYYADPAHWQDINGGYVYRNYREVFQAYLFHAKDPVTHPLMQQN